MTADEHYEAAGRARAKGDWKGALEHLNDALALDPHHKARTAKEMTLRILAFYCKDAFNP